MTDPARRKPGRDLSTQNPQDHPEDRKGAARATQENDLTTGHSTPGDGGDQHRQHPLEQRRPAG